MQRLKVREGETLRYDTGIFQIEWFDKLHSPAVGAHVRIRRSPQFIRDYKRINVWSDDERVWLGHADRKP